MPAKTHGLSNTPEYQIWQQMKQRYYNENNPAYPDYGGRGIRVCDKWLRSFESFIQDLGPCPQGNSIDRINPDGDYEPQNVRWADHLTQNRNKRGRIFGLTPTYLMVERALRYQRIPRSRSWLYSRIGCYVRSSTGKRQRTKATVDRAIDTCLFNGSIEVVGYNKKGNPLYRIVEKEEENLAPF